MRETAEGEELYGLDGVRPLNITNSDNRLIAGAARLAIEATLGELIAEDQRGFLAGRSMLANILDVEESMLVSAFLENEALAIFYDFMAAFPSVEHELLHGYFSCLGWPRWLCRIIVALYHNNSCVISIGGTRQRGFGIFRGIRQGCPLSPILFAAVSELLLRRMKKHFSDSTRRAWADDLAMVIPHGMGRITALRCLFEEFALISGLELNIPKTVIVPLFQHCESQLRDGVRRAAPRWAGISIARAAKYLGLYVGPGRGELSWKGPVDKCLERARLWGKIGAGMFTTLNAYRIYILPQFFYSCRNWMTSLRIFSLSKPALAKHYFRGRLDGSIRIA